VRPIAPEVVVAPFEPSVEVAYVAGPGEVKRVLVESAAAGSAWM
jgi:hypothetical protein